ncbi:hypothetical protein L486_07756 [Kwoniella mangroviensis CBS 10435]|uniref:DUF985 domain-containing protein n=1 Tax=Kwoniella mangroviensis CBS 10435 TaxID=1331196 RepID=A0A1B9IGU1_9TREE|nr:uncharacterized protein I203_07059 [Kwoniella mangroviensis CBS 8507]OCF54624.1 hypothetical protein L486_07756 [Kwoniella mangroviensis CBS 10435]OCF63740.1 hypothetical protein I203_07059 [Kwoniella mangroviensis CBS 8507]OCF78749.1 hypothetical protein I204_00693 [Kwoniella mangroviensis CBS 8886]
MSSISPPYPYPVTNPDLIKAHSLIKHFEGGYFAQTVGLDSVLPTSPTPTSTHVPKSAALRGREQTASGSATEVLTPAPTAEIQGSERRTDATQIYYLLTPESYRGRMHMNLHSTFHLHHSGRALYTLIKPPSSPSETPTIHRVILGPDVTQGEVTQLFVPGGWWKASEIPDEDLLLLDAPDAKEAKLNERIGCLISEVVVPGWNPDQHQFIDEDKLKTMWGGKAGWDQYVKYIKAPEGLEYPDK